jgi:hypothetical protein
MQQLVGTWQRTATYNENGSIYTDTIQYTVNADGTVIELHDRVYSASSETHTYWAFKGTFSVDAEGNVTYTTTDSANLSSFSTDNASWTPYDHPNTSTWPALVIGNRLYVDSFLIAQGSVSGIVGTWTEIKISKTWDYTANAYVQKYDKTEVIFNNDGTVIQKSYESSDGTFDLPSSTITATYTYSNDTLTGKDSYGNIINTIKVAIDSNKYLISGDGTSATANAFIKQ